jgi:anti-sigma regulatory factor (Ser/Thr protein kinase)
MSAIQSGRQRVIAIHDSSQIGEARRTAAEVAAEAACDTVQAANLAIVVTELATNIVVHTKGGQILLQAIDLPAGRAVEVLALDKGPGMANPARCVEDNYSTRGTQGNGLARWCANHRSSTCTRRWIRGL